MEAIETQATFTTEPKLLVEPDEAQLPAHTSARPSATGDVKPTQERMVFTHFTQPELLKKEDDEIISGASEQILKWMLDAAQYRKARYQEERNLELLRKERLRIAQIEAQLALRQKRRTDETAIKRVEVVLRGMERFKKVVDVLNLGVRETGKAPSVAELTTALVPTQTAFNETDQDEVDTTEIIAPPETQLPRINYRAEAQKQRDLARAQAELAAKKQAEAIALEKANKEQFIQTNADRILTEFRTRFPNRKMTGQELIMFVMKDAQLKNVGIVNQLKVVDRAVQLWDSFNKQLQVVKQDGKVTQTTRTEEESAGSVVTEQASETEQVEPEVSTTLDRQHIMNTITDTIFTNLEQQKLEVVPMGPPFNELLQEAMFEIVELRDPDLPPLKLTTDEIQKIRLQIEKRLNAKTEKILQSNPTSITSEAVPIVSAPTIEPTSAPRLTAANIPSLQSMEKMPVSPQVPGVQSEVSVNSPDAPTQDKKPGFFKRLFGWGKK